MCRSREPATRTGARATALLATALLLLALPVAAVRAAPATLVSPVPGGAALRADAVFQWTAVASASVYYLYVGTSHGAKDIVNSGELAGTSLPVSGLPAASTVYVRLSTKDSGSWVYVDYVFTNQEAICKMPFDKVLQNFCEDNDVPWAKVVTLYRSPAEAQTLLDSVGRMFDSTVRPLASWNV